MQRIANTRLLQMSLLLTPAAATGRGLPREYNMVVTQPDTINTFIFSEKDLPGYKKYTPGRAPPSWKERKRVEKTKGPPSKFGGRIPSEHHLFSGRGIFIYGIRTDKPCRSSSEGDQLSTRRQPRVAAILLPGRSENGAAKA